MGLSPCVWGHRYACNTFLDKSGSIPMCMGPPGTERRRSSHEGVYPHVYGATQTKPLCRQSLPGLSPCVWGHLAAATSDLTIPGAIPMCMWPPRWSRRILIRPRVYPHVYGATNIPLQTNQGALGQGPRVWG